MTRRPVPSATRARQFRALSGWAAGAGILGLLLLCLLLWRLYPEAGRMDLLLGLLVTACLFTAVLAPVLAAPGSSAKHRLFESLFEQAPSPRVLADAASGSLLEANPAAEDLFGLDRALLLRRDIRALLNLRTDQLPSPGQAIQNHQLHLPAAGHEARELRITVTPLQIEEQALHLIDLEDVTESQRLMAELAQSREQLEVILDASTDAIVLTDEQGRIQLFSPAAETIFGYRETDSLNRPLGLLMPKACAEGPVSWIAEATPDGQGTVREVMGERKDGREIPLRVSLNRICLGDQRHYLALIQDLSEQKRNEERLSYMESFDVLTGLLNRSEFERRLDALLSSTSDPAEAQYTVCHIDVDQFKVVNDTCGHAAGDVMLQQLAILIRAHLREFAVIARTGGDEFGILLPDCTVDRTEDICNGLLGVVRNFVFTWQERSFEASVSIGISGFRPHTEQASEVLSQADVACHMAKRLGRDRLHVYHQGDTELIRHHGDMHLVSTIHHALNEGRFHLYAQPIAPISRATRGERDHYEILVRMVDEHGRLVIPDKFIPAAERYILMPDIDRWVIGSLFSLQAETLRRWADEANGRRGFLFGINLSGTSLTDEGFLAYLKRQFTEHAVPYRAICFEITETAAVANLEKARAMIEELKSLGCSFALDDFGTGLSSYAYLKLLPVDYLKIDGGFVRNMTEDPVDYAMVDSINHIGHILGLKTIAEWAENPGTLTQLRALNVDYAQGYGVGEMISLEDFSLEPRH